MTAEKGKMAGLIQKCSELENPYESFAYLYLLLKELMAMKRDNPLLYVDLDCDNKEAFAKLKQDVEVATQNIGTWHHKDTVKLLQQRHDEWRILFNIIHRKVDSRVTERGFFHWLLLSNIPIEYDILGTDFKFSSQYVFENDHNGGPAFYTMLSDITPIQSSLITRLAFHFDLNKIDEFLETCNLEVALMSGIL